MSTWPPLPEGLRDRADNEMLRRLRAMDAEIYGDITAESGSITGNFDISGNLTVTGDISTSGDISITDLGSLYISGQGIFFQDEALGAIIHDVGADVAGGMSFLTGGYGTDITSSHDNSGTDKGYGEVYLRSSGAFADAAAWIVANESATGPFNGVYVYADGTVSSDPHILFEVDDEDVAHFTTSGLEFLSGNNLYFYESGGSVDQGIQFEDSGGASRWAMRMVSSGTPYTAISNRASNGEVRMYANTSTAGSGGEVLVATFEDTHVEIANGIDIRWANNSTKPVMIMDSNGGGADTWTDQGAHIVMGEQAANEDTAAAALHLTYKGDGTGYIGMGALTSGVPAYGLKFHYTTGQVRHLNDGSASAPSWSWSNNVNTGMYRFGTNEIGFAANGAVRVLIGTYGLKVDTAEDLLPRSDNSSQLGASGARYIDVWAVDTTINSSDATTKKDISAKLPLDAMQFVKDTPPLSFVREGRKRKHYGWTAQQIKRAMDIQQVDWGAYIDPEIGGVPKGKRAEDGFGHGPLALRQAELVPVLWQAVIDLERRVAELEGR